MDPRASLRLDEQVAVVTGAAKGIGKATALMLAHYGARVVIADFDLAAAESTAREITQAISPATSQATSQTARAVRTDISKAESVDKMAETALKEFGQIDILVNNAGIGGHALPIAEVSEAEWDQVLDVNLKGAFFCCRAVVPHMQKRKSGKIVNVASIAGKEGNPRMIPYSVSKAGLIGMTKALAKEVVEDGIRVNCVAPAVIGTSILDTLTDEQVRYMTDRIPMKRVGKPEEVAAVIHFLASEASSFVTGQCYDVSGGRATY